MDTNTVKFQCLSQAGFSLRNAVAGEWCDKFPNLNKTDSAHQNSAKELCVIVEEFSNI